MSSRAAPGSRRVSASSVRMYFVPRRSAGSPARTDSPPASPRSRRARDSRAPRLRSKPAQTPSRSRSVLRRQKRKKPPPYLSLSSSTAVAAASQASVPGQAALSRLRQVRQQAEHEVLAAVARGEGELLDTPRELRPGVRPGEQRGHDAHAASPPPGRRCQLQPQGEPRRQGAQKHKVANRLRQLPYRREARAGRARGSRNKQPSSPEIIRAGRAWASA